MSVHNSVIFLLSVCGAALILIWGARHIFYRARRLVRSLLAEMRTANHEARVISGEIRELRAGIAELNRATKTQIFFEKPVVKELLSALQNTDCETGFAEPSYGLKRVMDRLVPRLVQGKNSDTVICTLAVGESYRDAVKRCLDSHQLYAAKHGFSYCVLETLPAYADRPISWYKIPLIARLLAEGYKKVFYIDADAMITNPDFKIGPLFDRLQNNQKSLLLTEDDGGINSGAMLIQKTNAAIILLDLIWLNDADIHNGTWEQFAHKSLMDMSNDVRDAVSIEPDPKIFNSFPIERRLFHITRDSQIWSSGDFICHFSGIRPPDLERYIEDYTKALKPEAITLLADKNFSAV